MKVLHVGKFFPPHRGGMESYLCDLIQAQRSLGVHAHALVHGNPTFEDEPWLRRSPVQFTLAFAPFALGFRRHLRLFIRDIQPDVIHVHLPNVSAFWLLTLKSALNRPWVIHWHSDVLGNNPNQRTLKWLYKLYSPFESALLSVAKLIIATSPPYLATSRPLRPWLDKCWVEPLSINDNFARGGQTSDLDDTARHDGLPWLPDKHRLLSVGRLAHYKGFDTLIQAVAAVPDAQLLIVGDGECRPQLEQLIDSLGSAAQRRVKLLGTVSEELKLALLSSCDLFCLASNDRTEAFGIAVLEAMAAGKPCMVSQLEGSGMPWLVRSTGCGWSDLPSRDPSAWARAIGLALDQPSELLRRGVAGRAAIKRSFSGLASAYKIVNAYRHVVTTSSEDQGSSALNMRVRKTLVVVPARDESATIGGLVSGLRNLGYLDVLVIDDHSLDNTGVIAAESGAMVVRPVLPLGAWGGMQLGMRCAYRLGFDVVVTMDADGQHHPEEISALVQAAELSKADVVVGAHVHRASVLRSLAWRWFRALTGFTIKDLTSGFRLYNHSAVATLVAERATLLDYQDLGVLMILKRAGLSMTEVNVNMTTRVSGKSRIFNSWLSVFRYMVVTTFLCLANWRPRRLLR